MAPTFYPPFFLGVVFLVLGLSFCIGGYLRNQKEAERAVARRDYELTYARWWKDRSGSVNYSTSPVKVSADDPGPPAALLH